MTTRAPVLSLLGWLALSACGADAPQPVAASKPVILDMAQLDAQVKQNLGRGCLVNVWATY